MLLIELSLISIIIKEIIVWFGINMEILKKNNVNKKKYS